jgi:hypothetical protein
MSTEETQRVWRRYFDALTSLDRETAAATLDPGLHPPAGEMQIRGRGAFLAAAALPTDAETAMVAEAYQGEVGFQIYDSSRGNRTVRIVDRLTVGDGAIVSSTTVSYGAAFMAFMNA